MKHCILIASGGTGGHLYPTIAVAEEIRKLRPDIRVAFIGTSDRIEGREVPRAGFEFFSIDIQAPGRTFSSIALFPLKYLRASRQAKKIIQALSPSVFLGGGAYLSVPAAFAAKAQKIPVALLEINAVPGRANKVLARIAEKIFVAYPEAIDGFGNASAEKIKPIGTPVRESLAGASITQQEARKHFGLHEDQKTLLVFGGSLGARSLNAMMAEQAGRVLEQGYNIIWQTGKSADINQLRQQFPDRSNIAILEYLNEMDKAYAACDLVVARAGASTLAELATLRKPAILVPYPLAVKNHQEHNARAFEQVRAAIVITDDQLQEAGKAILRLLASDEERAMLSNNIQHRENKEARKVVAQWLIARCIS